MSQINAELVAGAEKSKLIGKAEEGDRGMEVDAKQRSKVESCGQEDVKRGSESVGEGAEFEVNADGDIIATLKMEISTLKDAILKQEAYLKAKVAYLQTLEQQLAAIEREKATKVAEAAQEQSDEDGITPDPVKMALGTPKILENILGMLDFDSLMGSRLVAKYWDEAALNVFSGKLNLEKLFKSSDFGPFSELKPKLIKRICFSRKCYCYDYDPFCIKSHIACDCNSSKQKLLMFFENFSPQTEEINVDVCAIYTQTFLKAITNRCPNLKSLHLESGNPKESSSLEAELNQMEGMPHDELFRMNLKTIELNNEFGHQTTSFFEKVQRIINRSPNLARLKLVANYYPNLTNNKYLKHLDFNGRVNEPNFSQIKLSEMLDQVKDSLEVLEIWTQEVEDSGGQNPRSFNFPVMKILKKLIIRDIVLHPLEQDGTNFIKTIASKFPNLEYLSIENRERNGVEMMFNKAMQGPLIPLFKIQTLILDRIQNPSVLALFSRWFPNLNKLKFSMPEDGDIKALFSALRRLKLKHFYFSMGFRFEYSDLVLALYSKRKLFKGLEILEIHADADKGVYDDLGIYVKVKIHGRRMTMTQAFCDWLRTTTKNMKKVTFKHFNFSEATAMEVKPVIREHKLPVQFI